jgi:hypothetical protein
VSDTYAFARKLRSATVGRFQLTTDGFHLTGTRSRRRSDKTDWTSQF